MCQLFIDDAKKPEKPHHRTTPTVDFKEDDDAVVIEVDCGDVGAIKVERTTNDNEVAFFQRTASDDWQQIEIGRSTELLILVHTLVEAFVALNREGITPPAPAGPLNERPGPTLEAWGG